MPSIARDITRFSKREIDYLFKTARRLKKNEFFTLLYMPRTQLFSRILVIISKKVGNAPVRNTIKRQIRSIFYEEKFFNLPSDYAIIFHKPAAALSFQDLKKQFIHAIL